MLNYKETKKKKNYSRYKILI